MTAWKQKTVSTSVLAIWLWFAGVSAVARIPAADLIANGSFDNGRVLPGELPEHWISFLPFPGSIVASSEGQGRNGTRCGMVLTKSDQTALLVSDPPSPVAPGEELTVSGWCRVEGTSTHSGGVVACSVGLMDDNNRYLDWIRCPVNPPSQGGWFHVEQKVKIPEKTRYVTLQLGLRYMTGQVWWDDVSLRGAALTARFGLDGEKLEASATTVPLLVINRDPRAGGREVAVTIDPGGRETRHTITAESVTTVPAAVAISQRGRVVLKASLRDGDDEMVTTQSVTVPMAIIAEPLSPTHWVVEDKGPARIEEWAEVHPGPDVKGATALRFVLENRRGSKVASLTSNWANAPQSPSNPIKLEVVLPEQIRRQPGEYRVSLQLLRGQKVLTSESEDWHVIHRSQSRVTMSDDGYPVVNGKRVFPLGLYMGEGFPELARLGFNIMQSYPAFAGPGSSNRTAKDFLDRTQAAGMKALTFISHGPDRLNDAEALRRIRMFRNHPATMMWYQEEGVARGYKPLSYMQNLYETLKREAPDHPVFVGDQRDKSTSLTTERGDTFPADFMDAGIWWWYPTPLRSKASVENYEGAPGGEAKEYKPPLWLTDSGTTKPIWVALQCYKKPISADARFPTPEEYRCQAYLAICHGAKGLMYYTGTGEHGHGVQNLPVEGHWEYLKKLVAELHEMLPVFLAPDAPHQVTMTPADALISTRLKQVGSKRVLIAVNRAARPAEVTFNLPASENARVSKPRAASVRFEGRNVRLSKTKALTDRFTGYAVHIYDLK